MCILFYVNSYQINLSNKKKRQSSNKFFLKKKASKKKKSALMRIERGTHASCEMKLKRSKPTKCATFQASTVDAQRIYKN